MKKDKKTKVIVILTIIAMIVVIVVGFTYAYFTATIQGNEEAKTTRIKTCKFDLDFTTSEYITNNSAELIAPADVSTKADSTQFTVTNSSNCKNAQYSLSLSDINISDNLKSADFKWRLEKNGSVLNSGNFANIGTSITMNLMSTNQTLVKEDSDSYILRVWLEETSVDQSSLYDGTFSAKVTVDAKTLK